MELVVQQYSEVILGGQYTVPSQPTLQGQKIDFYKQTQFVHQKKKSHTFVTCEQSVF